MQKKVSDIWKIILNLTLRLLISKLPLDGDNDENSVTASFNTGR